ncbi:MAG: hypothetical protein R3336_09400 [Phycisphaeraceae bacterium]|nr:hypothetical protein [Phycisphaeraceae bacterium]
MKYSFAILVPVLLIVLVVLPLWGLIRGIILLVRGGKGDSMVCGHCDYAVKGLTKMSCPECGADLREVGIQREGGRSTLGICLTVGCGLVLLLVLAGTGFLFVA